MKILYCRSFGLGNAICAIPALRALRSLYCSAQIDVLIGSGPDDVGALFVFQELRKKTSEIDNIWVDHVPLEATLIYDVAIQAIPYDGRWKNDVHFSANEVLDGLSRPDPRTMGFSSWKKHETEYQMDTIRNLGYVESTPTTYFGFGKYKDPNCVYLGMGYKKSASGFWSQKHWGNENYAQLIQMIKEKHPEIRIKTSGDILDLKTTVNPVNNLLKEKFLEVIPSQNLHDACELIAGCKTYIGNDTGMAHVAYSASCNAAVIFKMDNAWTKSGPVGNKKYEILKGHDREITPTEFLQAFERVHYGEDK